MWRHSVSTWRHEVTELTIHILACRCARKMILFLFLWYFESHSSKLLLISHLYDAVTSWRHVMTSQNLDLPISACRCARKLILFLFPWFFRSLSSKMLLIFYLCDDVTSWRHFMTSRNLIYLSQLVDVLESLFFFVSIVFQITEFKNVIDFLFVWWRDVMTSCHDVTKPGLPISACRCTRELNLFLFLWFFRSLSSKLSLIFHLCDDVTSWRHVMTSRNLVYLSQLVDVLESWFFFCFYGFLGHWVQKFEWFSILSMFLRRDVMSWRHKNCFTYLRLWIC